MKKALYGIHAAKALYNQIDLLTSKAKNYDKKNRMLNKSPTGGITMTITGALTGLDCRRNGDKITAIDVSGNADLPKNIVHNVIKKKIKREF